MKRETLKVDREIACDIAFGSYPDFEVIESKIIDQSRWTTVHDVVVKRKSDDIFFKSFYSVGSTESQDQSPYEYDEPIFRQVVPVEVTVVTYDWIEETSETETTAENNNQ